MSAPSFAVDSDSQITGVAPEEHPGPVDVTVYGTGGWSNPVAADTYTYTPLAVSGVSPAQGSDAGGDLVTIIGSGFRGAQEVDFGGTPATSVTVESDRGSRP